MLYLNSGLLVIKKQVLKKKKGYLADWLIHELKKLKIKPKD
jgi:hypothetical protein